MKLLGFFYYSFIFFISISENKQCTAKADVVFLFDDSGSVGQNPQNYVDMKKFMKDIVGKFTVFGQKGMQFSGVCFSSGVKEHFPLNKYDSKSTIQAGIDNDIVPTNGGSTRIGLGLEVRTVVSKSRENI